MFFLVVVDYYFVPAKIKQNYGNGQWQYYFTNRYGSCSYCS